MNHEGMSVVKEQRLVTKPGVPKPGSVEGRKVPDILIDTGCSRTLVRKSLVPDDKILQGEVVAIRCAHGDTVLYPLALVQVQMDGHTLEVEAAVSDNLPMSMLLGTDVPEMVELLGGQVQKPTENAMATTTRAQAKRQQQEDAEREERQEKSGARAHPVEDMDGSHENKETSDDTSRLYMSHLPDDMFQMERNRTRLTRSEKREGRKRYQEVPEVENEQTPTVACHDLDITPDQLKALQDTDPTLKAPRKAANKNPSTAGVGFFRKDGLIYRRWVAQGREPESMSTEQIVLPKQCQAKVLELAHSIPLAGHLGKEKTTRRVLQRFYWPTLYNDVAEYCRQCGECQKTTHRGVHRAPLIPLPIIDEPFHRIAMDIVGPLPRSRSGKRYILVVCDYATRYPEAIPLRSIDAECIAEELVTLFSRVGVPSEILTDQGSNFTSQLLTEIYRMLHVHPIRTMPYHPQTDGLVERFNKTLKSMLRKYATKEGKDWDKLIPYLLFAYREVPQASTGFSPFELLYGRSVRGPLDIVRESWEAREKSDESVVSHVLSMRKRLEKMSELARENLATAQARQKTWYDKNSRIREFAIGDQVLVLLPTSTNKLLAEWQGPYKVVKRMGEVDYQIEMHDRRKKLRVFHVNMLRRWYTSVSTSLMAEEIDDEFEGEIPFWRENSGKNTPRFGAQLEPQQEAEVKQLLAEYEEVFRDEPGRTTMAEHDVITGDTQPVRLPTYRLPHAYREPVKQEMEEMLDSGIIVPSQSPWSAPIVPVTKKDGSLRLCVDFRRLNSVSKADAYPIPRVDELIDRLDKAKYLSVIDLTRGYWQIPLVKTAQEKTAFSTPFGLFQFTVMPFGLRGAPATFQRLMDQLIRGQEEFAAAYIDNIIVHSKLWTDHPGHVREVLQRIKEAGLTVKARKCQFGTDSCVYLGHKVGNGTVRPEDAKIASIKALTQPEMKKDVRTFLGITGYYRRFIPNYASVAAPLTDLTRKAAPNKVVWDEKCGHAFNELKDCLCQQPVLRSPDFEKDVILQTDASDRGVGAVLSQKDDQGNDFPIAYYSRKFLPREERYSTVEKECLAIKLGVQAFRVYLLGRNFIVQTDHQALVWLDRLKDNNARLTRWSLALQPYSFQIIHRPGKANGNADMLSRAATTQFVAGEGGRSVVD